MRADHLACILEQLLNLPLSLSYFQILLAHSLDDHAIIPLDLPLEHVYLVFDLLRLDPDLPVLVFEHPPPDPRHDPLLPPPGLQVPGLPLIEAGVIDVFLDDRLYEFDVLAPTDTLGEAQVIFVKDLQDVLVNRLLDDFDGLLIAGLLLLL